MANRKDSYSPRHGTPALVRTSILVPADVDSALRQLADEGQRPLSWEIRRALEDHVERQAKRHLDNGSKAAA